MTGIYMNKRGTIEYLTNGYLDKDENPEEIVKSWNELGADEKRQVAFVLYTNSYVNADDVMADQNYEPERMSQFGYASWRYLAFDDGDEDDLQKYLDEINNK